MGVSTGPLPLGAAPLIGRDAELAALGAALGEPHARVVTLTGPPGVGKTRLALAAATALGPGCGGDVAFVDLTGVRDPALVVAEVARALGIDTRTGDATAPRGTGPAGGAAPGGGDLARALADRAVLLVIDNCEHVLDAASELATRLAACPGVRILATSRECLRVSVECEFPVRPLALPAEADLADLARFAATPAVAMLVDRVRRFQPDFAVTAANAGPLGEICLRLDGLPLALELAAARLKLFSPAELTFRLRHRMALLTTAARDVPARHRTLRAALAWSHDLLGPGERAVFRRLAVFVGGATLEAAGAVCAGDDRPPIDVVETLASLLDKSLVLRRTRPDGIAEFVLLESLREFAGEQLEAHGEAAATRARHAAHHTERARRLEALMGTGAEQDAAVAIGSEEGNLRAALDHCTATGRIAAALALASALGWADYIRGLLGRGRTTVDQVLATADAAPDPAPDDVLGGTLLIASVLTLGCGEAGASEALLHRALAVGRRAGCPRRVAIGSAFLGHHARVRGDFRTAAAHHERAGELHEAIGAAPGVAWSRHDLGLLARRRGDLDAAAAYLRDGLHRFRELEHAWGIGHCGWVLATVLVRAGDPDEAARVLTEALDRFEAMADGRGTAHCLEAAAAVAQARGAAVPAARLLGAAGRLRETLAAPLPADDRPEQHRVTQAVRRSLGPQTAERERRAGRVLSAAHAVALARRNLVAADPAPAAGLTPRERQVAGLVATGRTNRQIGRALGIAEKTAEVHVHNIIRKLDVRSRTEVAVWASTRAPGEGAPH